MTGRLKVTKSNNMVKIFLLFLVSAYSFGEIEFSGHVKTFMVTQEALYEEPRTYQSQNNVRFMLDDQKADLAWELHYQINPIFMSRKLSAEQSDLIQTESRYRFGDITQIIGELNPKHFFIQNLDRLNVQLRLAQGDLTLGRQAISFGSARVINPTDIFIPFDVTVFDQEYRVGVDAIRYQSPLGELGEFDLGVVFGSSRNESAAFLQLSNNYWGKDLQFTISRFDEQNLLGAGLQTAIGQFGFWFEIAKVYGQREYTRGSSGFDYAFSERSFGQIEYHYNGANIDKLGDREKNYKNPRLPAGIFLFGEHYLIPSFNYQLGPLWMLALQGIFNISDDSSFLSLAASYSVKVDVDANITYYRFHGDKNNSEYGLNPDMAYFGLSYYF